MQRSQHQSLPYSIRRTKSCSVDETRQQNTTSPGKQQYNYNLPSTRGRQKSSAISFTSSICKMQVCKLVKSSRKLFHSANSEYYKILALNSNLRPSYNLQTQANKTLQMRLAYESSKKSYTTLKLSLVLKISLKNLEIIINFNEN